MNPQTARHDLKKKMQNHKILVPAILALAIFVVGIPSLTPHVYAAAAPCSPTAKCGIAILSPGTGGVLNKNQTVNPTFLVSFLVHNFTMQQPGRTGQDLNTTGNNEGHIHVFVDNAYVTIWTSLNGIPLTLAPGTHTIRLDLVNDLHQEFSPGINATTTVNVIDPNASVQSTATNAQSNASNAMYYSLGALILSLVSVILVAYVAFKPKPKP
jgi:hypothetical protein